jgi:hypothetical protein
MSGDAYYCVMRRFPISRDWQTWTNYRHLRDAEEAAYALIVAGHAIETEIFAVTEEVQRTSVYKARRENDGRITIERASQ